MTIALELVRTFDAPPARVFACFTSKTEMNAWMSPYDMRGEVLELEPRVGGRYRIIMRRPDGSESFVGGAFQAIEPPTRIAFTWKWEAGEADTLVIVELEETNGKTRMTFRQEGFNEEVYRDKHVHGWTGCLDKLEAHIAASIGRNGIKAA